MNDKVRILLEEARKLTSDEQEQLLAALLDSMDETRDDVPLDRAELRRRHEEVRSGRAVTIDADLAIRAVRTSLQRARQRRG